MEIYNFFVSEPFAYGNPESTNVYLPLCLPLCVQGFIQTITIDLSGNSEGIFDWRPYW